MAPPAAVAVDPTLTGVWDLRHLQPVQLMVCNVLHKWIASYLYDDDLDPPLLQRYNLFVSSLSASERSDKVGKLLKAAMLKRRAKVSRTRQSSMPRELIFSEEPPRCLFTGADRSIDRPAHVAAAEWARQLTLIEVELFSRIRPSEMLHQAWTKKDKLDRAPHVHALIAHSNTVASWVASVVLHDEDISDRAEALGHMVEIVTECIRLRNFNAAFEVMAGLDMSAVHRLKCTKAKLHPEQQAQLAEGARLVSTDGSRSAYREALRNASQPCIPYLGVYLTDLIFIEDGNVAHITVPAPPDSDGVAVELELINWRKHEAYAGVIDEVRFYQQVKYNLRVCQPLEEYLRQTLTNPDVVMNEKDQYERSLVIEPRSMTAALQQQPTVIDTKKTWFSGHL